MEYRWMDDRMDDRMGADDFEGVNEFGTKVQRGGVRASSRMHSCGLRAVTAN